MLRLIFCFQAGYTLHTFPYNISRMKRWIIWSLLLVSIIDRKHSMSQTSLFYSFSCEREISRLQLNEWLHAFSSIDDCKLFSFSIYLIFFNNLCLILLVLLKLIVSSIIPIALSSSLSLIWSFSFLTQGCITLALAGKNNDSVIPINKNLW